MAQKKASQQSSRSFKHHRKKRRNKKIIFTIAGLSLITVVSVGAFLFYLFTQAGNLVEETQESLDRGEVSDKRNHEIDPIDDNISVLMLGTDNRDGKLDGIADAILLATFDTKEESVNVVSIPRDSYVEIPGHPTDDKINHAHAFGGADMAVDTVENLLEVPVDYYVTLNFDAFMDAVNIFDGVDVNSPMSFTEQDADGSLDEISIEEGPQTLNGEEALAYVRMRKEDPAGDLGRGERQQEVLGSLIDEATSLSSLTNYNQVFNRLQENMQMNISFDEITALHSYAQSIDDINYHQLEGESFVENGVDYFQVYDSSLEDKQAMLKQHLDLEDGSEPGTSESINAGENSENQ